MAEPARDLVQIRGLGKVFESRKGLFGKSHSLKAVSAVDLDIPRGKVTGVVGESGCGKSTLARLVVRLLRPSEGRITFDGVDLQQQSNTAMRRLRRRMQMVFQDPYSAIDPRYTIAAAVMEPFQIQGTRFSAADRTATVDGLLSMVGLNPQVASSYPHQVSGGQKQRIGIARALAAEPEFIICDEVTSSLDQLVAEGILKLLMKLQADLGLTYMFITHDLATVKAIADDVVVMQHGKVVEKGTRDEVFNPPHPPYTELLLSSVPEMDAGWLTRLLEKRSSEQAAG
jgi:oligopeptide transport system ATP-binding protein